MAIRSRKTTEHVVDIIGVRPGDTLKAVVRSLRPAIETYLVQLTGFSFDLATKKATGNTEDWANGYVAFGLKSIENPPTDPDTGKPFELVFEQVDIGGVLHPKLSTECVEALVDYRDSIFTEVYKATRLTQEERESVPFTSPPGPPSGLSVVAGAKETSNDVPPAA